MAALTHIDLRNANKCDYEFVTNLATAFIDSLKYETGTFKGPDDWMNVIMKKVEIGNQSNQGERITPNMYDSTNHFTSTE